MNWLKGYKLDKKLGNPSIPVAEESRGEIFTDPETGETRYVFTKFDMEFNDMLHRPLWYGSVPLRVTIQMSITEVTDMLTKHHYALQRNPDGTISFNYGASGPGAHS